MSQSSLASILLIGSAGHASVVADSIEREGRYRLAGCIDSFRSPGEGPIGYQVLGCEDDLESILRQYGIEAIAVAVGDNWKRSLIAERLSTGGFPQSFPAIIHPSAQIARTATVGEGSVILAGAVINSRASVGRWCIVNTNSSLDHDSTLRDFASLAPGATVGGSVTIGAYTSVSLGADVIHGINIGQHTVIGAGATVVRDIPDYSLAYGNPAKVRRSRQAGDPYL